MTAKAIAGIVPGLMATSLVVANIPKKFPVKPAKDMGMKRMVKLGMKNIVGIGLIGATAGMVNELP